MKSLNWLNHYHFKYLFLLTSSPAYGFQQYQIISPCMKSSYSPSYQHIVKSNTELYLKSKKEIEKEFDIEEIHMKDAFGLSEFSSTKCWGIRPLLMRKAFLSYSLALEKKEKIDYLNEEDDINNDNVDIDHSLEGLWPSWNEIMELATDEDAESRIITHIPNDTSSWRLEIGPFESQELNSLQSLSIDIHDDHADQDTLTSNDESSSLLTDKEEKWTMILNDVDRFYPPLYDFISDRFSFISKWRLDDGQISLSNIGGGIGPHIDDYDVFLIQMSGKRQWDIGKRLISTKEEIEGLVNDLDVRILDFWEDEIENGIVESFILEPGDAIYLPPRVAHSGIALSDGCMTLSIGLRAPSAKEMMTKLTEAVVESFDEGFVKRYTDPELLNSLSGSTLKVNEITKEVKMKGKHLISNAIFQLLDNDLFFDEFFGRIVTESNRARGNYPLSLDEIDDDEIQTDAKLIVELMLSGKCDLYAAEGTAWAYSVVENIRGTSPRCRLFVDGKLWEIDVSDDENHTLGKIIDLVKIAVDESKLSADLFDVDVPIPQKFVRLLEDLVQEGYLYSSK